MLKNNIIELVVLGLLSDRKLLVKTLAKLNTNDMNFDSKKMSLDMSISNIDMQLNQRVSDCELKNNTL
jgi:hypothetical protein